MKDTMISPQLEAGIFPIMHKSLMVDSKAFFALINEYRQRKGMTLLPAANIMQARQIKEYIELLKERGIEEPVKMSRGRGKSWIHLKVAIRIAIDAAPELADEVIDLFITKRLPILRDEGGELFKDMNSALAMHAEAVLGKPAHKGHYTVLATKIRERVLGKESTTKDWNTAPPEKHAERVRIEDRLASALNMGLVRDWEHLKELADKA